MGGVNFLGHTNDGFKATCIMEINKINKIGNYSPSGHNASSIVDTEGIAPAVMENHGTVTAIVEPKAVSYTRDKDGSVTDRHLNDVFNTIHTGTGGGGNTDCYIAEPMCSVHPLSHAKEFNPETSIKPISPALRATDYKCPHCVYEPRVMQVGNLYPDTDNFKNRTMGRVYSADGLSPTINCCGGGDREPKIIATRIRKLTPRECFRLMDVSEPDIDKLLNAGISNSQLYKLAGNSIVCSVIYHVMRKMFIEKENENQQLTLF